jgi:uncharacterized protein YjbI with pentapeptide repeats
VREWKPGRAREVPALALGAAAAGARAHPVIRAKWWRSVRKLLIALAWLLVVVAVFAAGVGIYFAALASWSLLRVWWPPLLAGTAAAVALGAWWLWWRLPKRQVEHLRLTIRDPKARADVEDNIRKTIGQLLGGAAVLVGAGFAYLQFQQQQTAAHDLLISNQVAKGFELLGHKDKDEITQRLGGIYALEGVMNTSKQYYQPVLEALCAFVRDATKAVTGDGPPASDIQAALTVIGRRATIGSEMPDLANVPDLANAHIPGTNLNDADLSGANLTRADLHGANMYRADLSDADLAGADLSRAKLIIADLRAGLPNAKLSGAFLIGANLSGADLNGADLSRADLLNADLSGASLVGADLSRADLHSAKGLTQEQLNYACGENVKPDPPLTFDDKPCPVTP